MERGGAVMEDDDYDEDDLDDDFEGLFEDLDDEDYDEDYDDPFEDYDDEVPQTWPDGSMEDPFGWVAEWIILLAEVEVPMEESGQIMTWQVPIRIELESLVLWGPWSQEFKEANV